jgi:ABC-type uncharacterized transport system substrate-binding protein
MKPRLSAFLAALVALAASVAASPPASAHPHVFVTAKGEIVYGSDGRILGVRHAWTFDEAYSAYATQGLDKNGDGKLTPDELVELAKVNVESLNEYGYFTIAKANGAKLAFTDPVDYSLEFANDRLTLRFMLPLKTPAKASKAFGLEIYDPTFFVAFTIAEGDDAITLVGAPKGCAVTVARPKPIDTTQQQKLSESFFSALDASSNFGGQFANKVIVACP